MSTTKKTNITTEAPAALQSPPWDTPEPHSAPLAPAANPVVHRPNVGTPDQPVHEMSSSVRQILADISSRPARAPIAQFEVTPMEAGQARPFMRTDW